MTREGTTPSQGTDQAGESSKSGDKRKRKGPESISDEEQQKRTKGPFASDELNRNFRMFSTETMKIFLDTLGNNITKEAFNKLCTDKQKATGKTLEGYNHLYSCVYILKGHIDGKYTYEHASDTCDEVRDAYIDGTYDRHVKRVCKDLGFLFAQD